MTYNEFEGKPLRWDQSLYMDPIHPVPNAVSLWRFHCSSSDHTVTDTHTFQKVTYQISDYIAFIYIKQRIQLNEVKNKQTNHS